MTPERARRVPLAVGLSDGSLACVAHGRIVARDGGLTIPLRERQVSTTEVTTVDWRPGGGPRQGRSQRRTTWGPSNVGVPYGLVVRCARGGCWVRVDGLTVPLAWER